MIEPAGKHGVLLIADYQIRSGFLSLLGCDLFHNKVRGKQMAKRVKCDRTNENVHLIDGYFVCDIENGEWCFVSMNAPEGPLEYSIPVSKFLGSPEEFVDWMAQINEKTWFSSIKFFQFFERFRRNNELFGNI